MEEGESSNLLAFSDGPLVKVAHASLSLPTFRNDMQPGLREKKGKKNELLLFALRPNSAFSFLVVTSRSDAVLHIQHRLACRGREHVYLNRKRFFLSNIQNSLSTTCSHS